jgi:uncharacterized protein (DUF302 family)
MSTFAEDNGIITLPSHYSIDDTVSRLTKTAQSKNLLIFATIDFSKDAEKAGLTMNGSRLLIVGNPKAGTPVMQAAPLAALDLPLKLLVWQDDEKRIWVSYNAPSYLQARHGISPELAKPLAGIVDLVSKALAD